MLLGLCDTAGMLMLPMNGCRLIPLMLPEIPSNTHFNDRNANLR
jgi:hypothetical protein